MSRFPFAPTSSVHCYTLDLPDGARAHDAPLTRLRDVLVEPSGDGSVDGVVYRSRVPPSLALARESLWGWCYLDERDPVSVGPWLVWGLRSWKKRVPPRLLAAVVDERAAVWCRDHQRERCPRSVRADLRDSARHELLGRAIPDVADAAVCLDVIGRRLVLPGVTTAAAEQIATRVLPLLRHVIHEDVRLVAWDLVEYLRDTRPAAVLPEDAGDRWLAWLAAQAAAERTATWTLPGAPDVVLHVALDGGIAVTRGAGTIRATGSDTVADVLRWAGEDAGVRSVRIRLTEASSSTRAYALRIDSTGAILGCTCIGGERWTAASDLEAACLDRADSAATVAYYARLLMHAYDAGPLDDAMVETRQAQLWPGHVAPTVTWSP